ncbi:MAG: nitroreductase family protein [Bacteroidaceae bacterium]|nr:nitroreductase family protein [Bacteroidaceae bacterium]
MKDFSELITMRRSHRKFTEEPVGEEQLKCLMRSALMAPSSKGMHSYAFVTVTDRDRLAALSQCKDMGAELIAGAPAAIVVLGEPAVSDAWVEDGSVAATMMLLQAEDLGLGACWVQVRERKDKEGRSAEDNVRQLLGIPGEVRVLCIVAVGHKGMERKPQNEERLKWERVHTEQW